MSGVVVTMLCMSPGQPNRRSKDAVPPRDVGGRAAPVVYSDGSNAGVGSHEIDHAWGPTDDVRVLEDRLRRRKAQVEKLKADRRELRESLKLRTEEAYIEGLLANAAKWQELDARVTDLAHSIMSQAVISEDDLKVLKAMLPEIGKQRDRAYGKVRQRVSTTSVSASVDINRLQERALGGQLGAGGSVLDPETIDLDPEDVEELGDE